MTRREELLRMTFGEFLLKSGLQHSPDSLRIWLMAVAVAANYQEVRS